jgi:hypothetical protein
MSSSASIVKNIQPHDVTAWTYDIEVSQILDINHQHYVNARSGYSTIASSSKCFGYV